MDGLNDLSALSTLLQESQESDIRRNASNTQPPIAGSATNIIFKNNMSNTQNKNISPAIHEVNLKDIWDIDEVPFKDSIIDLNDERLTPKYEFSYKQSVGTEDTFLGLNDKSPSSSDCTHLIIKVHFPKSTMRELDLDLTKNRIKAESRTHKLFTYLPVNVDHDNGKAKFDSKKEVLIVTLPIIYDI